jgi:hypothetical protein
MAIGVVAEVLARLFHLWVYHQQQTPVLNVVALFGLVMGGIAGVVGPIGLLPCFAFGFAVGLLYEVANLRVLKWWSFPGERLAFIQGPTAIVLALALLWGLVPPAIAIAEAALPGARRAATTASRLERLNERERQLLDKLEALRQREREVEGKLEEIRALRQALRERQGGRPRGAATPAVRP